jgi:hypothetical protein
MEPVDPNEAPDYYKVIKEPMGMWNSFTFITVARTLHYLNFSTKFVSFSLTVYPWLCVKMCKIETECSVSFFYKERKPLKHLLLVTKYNLISFFSC